jgi:hypothetical protein
LLLNVLLADAMVGVYVFLKLYSPRVRVPSRHCYGIPHFSVRARRYLPAVGREGYNSFVIEACSDGEFVSKVTPCLPRGNSTVF